MAIVRRSAALPEEFKPLVVLQEPINALVPYPPPAKRRVYYFFKRAEILGIAGQYRPEPRIEVVSILKEPKNIAATNPSETIYWHECSRETGIFDTPEHVSESIRLKGFLKTDVVDSCIEEYPYFRNLRFFNDVIPRPDWLDEKVK